MVVSGKCGSGGVTEVLVEVLKVVVAEKQGGGGFIYEYT